MKTERRHELQTNVLADSLGRSAGLAKPYGKQIMFGIGAVVVVLAVGAFLINDQSSRLSSGWSDFFAASYDENPERLHEVAIDHAGTTAGNWAQLAQADIELTRGIRSLYINRDSANASLERAIASYENVVDRAAQGSDLQNSARFGLAQARECAGDLPEAIENYDEVIANAPNDSVLAAQAEQRREQLQDPNMKKFYNWFANQKPVPRISPGFGLPPDLPANLGLIPDQPDLSFPGDLTTGDSPSDGLSEIESPLDLGTAEVPESTASEPTGAGPSETGPSETGPSETGPAEPTNSEPDDER
jgi:tetratricopeptide (TPR) repeat protein